MMEQENGERPRRARSLLSLADAMAEELAKPPAVDDAAARHRAARDRREAAAAPSLHTVPPPSPLPTPDTTPAEPAPLEFAEAESTPARLTEAAAPGPRRGLLQRIGGLFPARRRRTPAPVEPSAETLPAPVSEPAIMVAEPEIVRDAEPEPRSGRSDDRWRPLIDPMKVLGGISRSKALIVATTLLGTLIGVMIALSTPKEYESVAELLVDPRNLNLVDKQITTSGLPSDATLALVENQARVLTSGTVLNEVVERLHLDADPEFNGSAGGLSLRSMLRSLLSREEATVDEGRRHALAVTYLARNLSVERSGKTFVIVVTMKSHDGEKSALIVNTMMQVFLETSGKLQSDTAGRAADELTSRLEQLREGVEAAERKVEAFKSENDIVDAQGRLISDDEILTLNEQLGAARARTLELNARAASARNVDADAVVGGALPEEVTSNVMTEMRAQYASLKSEADRLAVKLGPRHPQRQAAEAQLAGARGQLTAELSRIVATLQTDLKRAVQLEQELASRLAQLKVRQGSLSDEMVTLRQLEREATARRAVYEAFLLRARETGEERDINSANMSVISPAYPPLESVGPSRATISLTGMMLGLFAGVGLGGTRGAYASLRESRAARPRLARVDARPAPLAPSLDRAGHFVAAPLEAEPSRPVPPDTDPLAAENDDGSIEQIRANLREVREALRQLSEERAGHRSS